MGLRTLIAGAAIAAVNAGEYKDSYPREDKDIKTLSHEDEYAHLKHYHEMATIRREDSRRRGLLDSVALTPEHEKEHLENYAHVIKYLEDHDPAKFGFLRPSDGVAISFWIISIAMVASTVFFLMESMYIAGNWKTSMNVGSLVTLIAAVHYFYMREYWVKLHSSPIVYRYIDWSLTVPLQMIEFYLILSAVNPNISGGMFWRLMFGTVCMLAFGYAGESLILPPQLGFVLGMAGWGFILYEIFYGEAGECAKKDVNQYVGSAFATCRFIVTVGWSIYPLGYFFGYMCGAVSDEALNLVYNLADFVNKIAFCLAIWHAAKQETRDRQRR